MVADVAARPAPTDPDGDHGPTTSDPPVRAAGLPGHIRCCRHRWQRRWTIVYPDRTHWAEWTCTECGANAIEPVPAEVAAGLMG